MISRLLTVAIFAIVLPLAGCAGGSFLATSNSKAQSMVFADHAYQASVETAELLVDQGKLKGVVAGALAIGTAAANAGIDAQWRQIFPAPASGDIIDDLIDQGRLLLPALFIEERHRQAANELIRRVQAEGRDIEESDMLVLADARQAIVNRVVGKLEAAAR